MNSDWPFRLAAIALGALAGFVMYTASAQDAGASAEQEAAYTRAITGRADEIVPKLGLTNTAHATRVRDIIVRQYRDLRAIHDARDARIAAAKKQAGDNAQAAEPDIQAARRDADEKVGRLHAEYLGRLSAELNPGQVDQVKDGMTYGVVQVTYQGYLKMLPDLTEEQKSRIMGWLVEAREIAMDAGTAKEKHAVFGKYKGRIVNYLSRAGYDVKAASKKLETKPASAPSVTK